MKQNRRSSATATRLSMCILFAICCFGCGNSQNPRQQTKRDLARIVLTYANFHAQHSRSPHNLGELLACEDPYAQMLPGNAATQSVTWKALKSDKYAVIWDAVYLKIADGSPEYILAYHKDAPEKGGAVCYQDGHVDFLTAAQFAAATKSKPAEAKSLVTIDEVTMLATITNIIAAGLSKPAADIEPDQTLESLGADDLDLVEIIMEMEDQFAIKIPDEALRAAAEIENAKLNLKLRVRDLMKVAKSVK